MEFVTFNALFISLLLFAHGIPEEEKIAFCDRASSATEGQPTIVAASKTDYPGKFFIFEANKTWLYDAEREQVEEFFDLVEGMKQKASGFEHKPIIRATGIRSCKNPEELSFNSQQFITAEKYFRFRDITNLDTWEAEPAIERNRELYEKYSIDLKEEMHTVGTSCYFDGEVDVYYIYVFALPNKYRACSRRFDKNAKEYSKMCKQIIGIFRPFGFDDGKKGLIETIDKIPDALAYDFGVNRTNQKALFVMGDVVTYWKSDDGISDSISKTTINEIFECKSSSIFVIVGIIVALFILAFVIAVVLVVIVILKNKSNFEDEETTTVNFGQKVQKVKSKIIKI